MEAEEPVEEEANLESEETPATRGGGPISEWTEVGLASWYGEALHGWPTASGEIFDMDALTGAHRVLPFGSLVRVVNLENGREVEVRINDRGPFVEGRIIDVSRAAARIIGITRSGTARVRLVLLN